MEHKELRKRIAKYCKENAHEAILTAEFIFEELQMKTIPEFAAISTLSERTLYNHVRDPENSKHEIAIFCNEKYIPTRLNKDLINA